MLSDLDSFPSIILSNAIHWHFEFLVIWLLNIEVEYQYFYIIPIHLL